MRTEAQVSNKTYPLPIFNEGAFTGIVGFTCDSRELFMIKWRVTNIILCKSVLLKLKDTTRTQGTHVRVHYTANALEYT